MEINKKRLLHVIPDFGTGGAEMMLKNLLLAHDSNSFEIAVCSLFPKRGTIIEKQLEESNVNVFYLNKKIGPDLKVIAEIYKLFKTYKPDIMHTHRYCMRYTLIPSVLCRIPIKIHTLHSIAEKEVDLPGKFVHKFCFSILGVHPVGISEEVSRTAEELYNIQKIPYIYNGISIDSYDLSSTVREETRTSLNISKEDFVIIHIGRFTQLKNHRLLIEAYSAVQTKIPKSVLLLIGDGEERLTMEELVKSRNLDAKIRFLGTKNNIPELLSAADLFVLQSDWEGVPLTILEAMAAAKPVISTAVGGVPEVIIDGVNGLLIKAKDPQALSDSISKLSRNRSLAKEMGEKGRIIVKEKFDIRTVTRHYENYYKRYL